MQGNPGPTLGAVGGRHPSERVRLRRTILGASAVLLPFHPDGSVDWPSFEAHLARTAEAGLVPAVNMDTGYVQLLDRVDRDEVLRRAAAVLDGRRFLAGAYVSDEAGAPFEADRHLAAVAEVATAGGTPVVFPSHGLTALAGPAWVEAHATLAAACDGLVAFELSPAFTPVGRIYDAETFRALLDVDGCIGAKHSSLRRAAEWDRLDLRDAHRPEFHLFTGNDLAIDMVMYGSDYLLGLSTFAPDLFARRDRLWADGDAGFYELNDELQHLGRLTFRDPVPAYRHSAAQFLRLRGWLPSDATPPGAPRRPDTDLPLLADVAARLGVLPS